MVQFKNLFTGVETRDYRRATTAQNVSARAVNIMTWIMSGIRRATIRFFEMMGNFSFGDYFKEEAIQFAWELITKEYGIPKDRLYTTVYHTDDEAFEIWKKMGGA